MPLYIFGIIGIGILYALFSRTGRRWLILVVAILVSLVVLYEITYVSPRDKFIKEENITVNKNGPNNEVYGETQNDYFILYPALYYKISKTSDCAGLDALNRDTWCGDEKIFPKCFDEDSCYLEFNKTVTP